MDYAEYLPHIDVKDGVGRILNNMKLYLSLLTRFKGRIMTDNLINAINENNSADIVQAAHALKGTAANLGFTAMYKITEIIEAAGKNGESCTGYVTELESTFEELDAAIKKLTAA